MRPCGNKTRMLKVVAITTTKLTDSPTKGLLKETECFRNNKTPNEHTDARATGATVR